MARCFEINLLDRNSFAILGDIKDWDLVKAEALKVDRSDESSGMGDWASIYRVQPVAGPERFYIVTKE